MKLYNRETSYYTIITIPKCLVSKYGKKQIWRSLNTKDYKLAKLRAELETMSIRRKLLNDLNKQKEKTSKALDFAQILDDDDDDFFEDDIDIKDTVDFSHYTEEEFAKLDDFYAMANMSHQTYEKFKEIKKRYRQQQKIQKALEKEKADNQIRSSIYDYDEQQAEDLAYVPACSYLFKRNYFSFIKFLETLSFHDIYAHYIFLKRTEENKTNNHKKRVDFIVQ